jgi:hypothetical protein
MEVSGNRAGSEELGFLPPDNLPIDFTLEKTYAAPEESVSINLPMSHANWKSSTEM